MLMDMRLNTRSHYGTELRFFSDWYGSWKWDAGCFNFNAYCSILVEVIEKSIYVIADGTY